MRYVGRHKFDDYNKWKTYVGGGTKVKDQIAKNGKETFTKTIIDFGDSEEELDNKEREYIKFFNAQFSNDYYNFDEGGIHPKERLNFRGENHYLFGKHPSEETCKRMSESMKGRIPPNKGGHASDETRERQRNAWVKRKERGGDMGTKKPVIVHPIEKRYDSLTDACNDLGLNYGSAINVASGRRKSVYGYWFEYVGGYINSVKEEMTNG